MDELRFLLLQARHPDDPMREQEHLAFAGKLGVDREQIVGWDLLKGPPAFSVVAAHDIFMMGGSGDFLVSQRDLPQFSALLDLLSRVTEEGFPTFASCFGFQCMVEALGGEIVYDAEATEVGTHELWLTDAGRDDPLLCSLPDHFPAQMGRKDRATRLPEGTTHLASSRRCPYQAFRVDGKPIWATQFHPELSGEENRERYVRYLNNYEAHVGKETQDEVLDSFRPTPETESMLPKFVEVVFNDARSPVETGSTPA